MILKFIAFLRALVIFSTMLLWMLGYAIKSIFIKSSPERAFALRRHWLRIIGHPILNLQVEVTGKPHLAPAIYVCNHRSFADPLVLCRYLDAYVIAKAEVANYPIISTGAKITGVIFVQRENKDSRNAVRDMMIDTVQKGYNVLVFPEGTVGVKEHTLEFRSGTFYEAADHKVPIVPIALDFKSPKDLWVIPNFVQLYFYQFSKWRTEARIHFGEALIHSDGEKLKNDAQQWINDRLDIIHQNWTEVDYAHYKDHQSMYQYKNFSK